MKKSLLLLLVLCFQMKAQTVQLSGEKYWAERTSATKYVLHNTNKKKLKIYVGISPKKFNWHNGLDLKDTLVIQTRANERMYFAHITKKKDTLVFSERRLWLENAPNFRDLGGLKTTDGKTVAWGKVFRCGDMGKLNTEDLEVLKNINIKIVVDFRNEQETKQSPDVYPSSIDINRVWTSISPSNSAGMKSFYSLMSNPNATKQDAETLFESFYAQMPENIKNYGPFFETLLQAKPDEATVFHCTAGKDRTGLGSALLLSALGVDEKTIVEEYFLSNRYTQYLAKTGNMSQMKPEIAEVLAGVQPKYILATLKVIKEKYGSVNQMLEKELGIDEPKRIELKKKFTL